MPVDGVGPTRPAAWIGSRVAHPARDLARSTAFYRDLLGFEPRGGFTGHDGYDGVFFALPGGGELELTAGPVGPTAGTEEDLLVLYVRTMDEVRAIGAGLAAAGVRSVDSPNPYWNRCGQTFLDPDGYRIVIAAAAVADGDVSGTRSGTTARRLSASTGTSAPGTNCGRCSSSRRTPGPSWTSICTREGFCWPGAVQRRWVICSSSRPPARVRSN